jgi:hypothetical protein
MGGLIMGWTGMQPPYHGDKKRWLQDEFTSENEAFRWSLTDLYIKGNQAYGIKHVEDRKTGITLHEALVFLLSFRKEEWSYKVMGESVHPYYYNAPKKLLDTIQALYPPINENAKLWREKCRERSNQLKNKKLEIGQVVKFAKTLDFRVFQENTFTYVKDNGKSLFLAKNGIKCRIPKWQEREHEILANVNDLVKEYHQQYGELR